MAIGQPIDEKGFVFIDDKGRPYMVKPWGDDGQVWLFYWHVDEHWVSLRPAKEGELFPDNLPQEQQDLYHEKNKAFTSRFEPVIAPCCIDCGIPYPFPLDTVLTNDQWTLIHPEDEGGLLCANCIVTRASRIEGAITTRMTIVFAEDIPT